VDESLQKLTFIRDNITDEQKRPKLKRLQDYLENNRDYLVNYDEREKAKKPREKTCVNLGNPHLR